MFELGEVRNSVFDDSDDEDSPGRMSSGSSATSSPSIHFEMIRRQMSMPSTPARTSLDIVGNLGRSNSDSNSSSNTFDMELAGDDDVPLPTRCAASSFASAYRQSGDSTVDRDQALRHSHVMETVRSLPRDERTGRLKARKISAPSSIGPGSTRVAKTAAAAAAARKSATLPAAPAKRQAVATARSNSITSSSQTSHAKTATERKSNSATHAALRRYTSDPTGIRAGTSRSLPRQMGRSLALEEFSEPQANDKLHLMTASTPACRIPNSVEEESSSVARSKPPRHLPPLSKEDMQLRPAKKRVGSLSSSSSISSSGSSLLAAVGANKNHGSLRERPSTGVPMRRPDDQVRKSPRTASRSEPRKRSAKLKIRKTFIIPEIVITTCPDIEMPNMPNPIVRQRPPAPEPPKKPSPSSFARKAAELRRAQLAKAANTTQGCFSVSY